LIRSFFIRRFLKRAFLDLRIDLDNYYAAFVPYSGHLSPFFDDFVDFFKSQGLKTIGVQENWDHLSSKAFIDCEPDVFCVWGEQSAGHLQNVHSLFNTKVLITGSPRMQPYYSSSIEFSHFYNLPRNLAERISRPYILLTGSGDGIDDEFILNEIYEALDYSQNFQIIYRPHLHARRAISHHCIAKFIAGGLIIDDHKSSREVFYHVGLVMNAELVINQFSTILVETLLCNKKILLPGFLDRNVTYDWIDACNSWHHFIGISTFPNVFISKSKENFKRDFKSALDSQSQDSSKSSNWIAAKLDVSSKYLESLSM
jgi:hypothetical protein